MSETNTSYGLDSWMLDYKKNSGKTFGKNPRLSAFGVIRGNDRTHDFEFLANQEKVKGAPFSSREILEIIFSASSDPTVSQAIALIRAAILNRHEESYGEPKAANLVVRS